MDRFFALQFLSFLVWSAALIWLPGLRPEPPALPRPAVLRPVPPFALRPPPPPLVIDPVPPAAAVPQASPAPGASPAKEASWLTDHAAALAEAKKSKRPVLMLFTGSDWCGWCKKLVAEILSQKEFVDYAAGHLVLLEIDFPRRKPQPAALKRQNEALQAAHNISGYPTIVVLGPEGKPLGELGYTEGGPPAFIKQLGQLLK